MKRKQRLVDRGRSLKENYPFPLMSKGREKEQMHGNKEKEQMHRDRGSDGHRGRNDHRGSMSFTMPSLFPSMPKGGIVEILVVIDVNP
jgi:hypothetical protein